MSDVVTLQLPRERDFFGVAHLVLGGLGARFDLTYDVLDDILQLHVERHQPAEDIIAAGFDAATVRRVLKLVRTAEFKRKQAAPGLKVTDRAFGTGWRMPIAKLES